MICSNKDPIGVAKVLAGVAKEMPKLKVKVGFLGTSVLTAEEIAKLATLPPQDVLVGKLLGLLKGMPQRLVYALSGNLNKLMLVIERN